MIDIEWRRAIRQKVPLALLMIDADHFKAYNDTFGHQAGDQVLVGVAICISDSVAGPATAPPATAAKNLRCCCRGYHRRSAGGRRNDPLEGRAWSDEPQGTTVSIGVASLRPPRRPIGRSS